MKMLLLFYMALGMGFLATCVRADNSDNSLTDAPSDAVATAFEGTGDEFKHRNLPPEMVRGLLRELRMRPYPHYAYTFGKLTGRSHDILIATVLYPDAEEGATEDAVDGLETEKIPDNMNEAPIVPPRQPVVDKLHSIIMALHPETYLLRQRGGEELIIALYPVGRRSEPAQGDRYLVFLRYREMPRAEALILGSYTGITGLINIDTDDGDDIIDVTRSYIKHLRGDALDHGAYFKFLHDLLDHPVERIRKDAKMDLMRLIDDSDAEQLIEVEKIDDLKKDIRWYTSYRRKWKTGEYQRPPPPEPSAEEIEKYRTLMQSEDQEEIREGMRILSRFYHWYRANPEQWVDVALPLLEHPFLLIRLSIAQRLTTVGHPASVPVIIEHGLQHERMPSRASSQRFLERMLGEEIDFDPRAPEDERKEQVEAFKQWWEENKHRYEYE